MSNLRPVESQRSRASRLTSGLPMLRLSHRVLPAQWADFYSLLMLAWTKDRPTELRGWRPSDQLSCFIFIETDLARDVRALLDFGRRFPGHPGHNSSPRSRLGLHVSLLLSYQLPEALMVGSEDVTRVDAAKELQLAHEGIEELLKLIRVACFVPTIRRRVLLGGHSSVLRQDRHPIGLSVVPSGIASGPLGDREFCDRTATPDPANRDSEGGVCRHRLQDAGAVDPALTLTSARALVCPSAYRKATTRVPLSHRARKPRLSGPGRRAITRHGSARGQSVLRNVSE